MVKMLYRYALLCFGCIVLMFLINMGCVSYKKNKGISEYKSIAYTLTAEEILQKHFDFLINKNEYMLKHTMTPNNHKINFDLKNLRNFDVLSVEEVGYDSIAQSYMPEDVVPVDATSFNVEFEVEYKKVKQQDNGRYCFRYVLIKESKDSPWLIADWGVNF